MLFKNIMERHKYKAMCERIWKEKKSYMLDYFTYVYSWKVLFSWVRIIFFFKKYEVLFYTNSESFICANLFSVRLLFHHVCAKKFRCFTS